MLKDAIRDRNPRNLGYGYAREVRQFLDQRFEDVLRELAGNVSLSGIAADNSLQQRAWEESLIWLATALETCCDRSPSAKSWGLCLEFEIPRRG